MSDKGFSGSSSRGRFDFSASGSYFAPYKFESLVVWVILGVMGAIGIAVLLFAIRLVRNNLRYDSSDVMMILAISIGLVFIEAILVILAVVFSKVVGNGYKCSYIASAERFMTTEGGNTRVINFREVQSVNFYPKTMFGKVRGYEVRVLLNGREEVYAIVSNRFISETSTPFHIINERVEAIRREDAQKRHEEELARVGISVSKPEMESINLNNHSSSNRLGQDAVMPAVGIVRKMIESPESEKVETVKADDGREHSVTELIGSGSVRLTLKKGRIATIILLCLVGVAISVWFGLYYAVECFAAAIAPIGLAVLFILRGEECSYRANGREFILTNRKGGEIRVAYTNAQSVRYLKTALGYRTEIVTSYGIVAFNCIDKRKNICNTPEKIPFEIISQRIK